MEITRSEYHDLMRKYWKLVNTLPTDVQEYCPNYDYFMEPATELTAAGLSLYHTRGNRNLKLELSNDGRRSYEMLNSQHARTLLMIWALNKKWQHEK